jgi:hypothetical protein
VDAIHARADPGQQPNRSGGIKHAHPALQVDTRKPVRHAVHAGQKRERGSVHETVTERHRDE